MISRSKERFIRVFALSFLACCSSCNIPKIKTEQFVKNLPPVPIERVHFGDATSMDTPFQLVGIVNVGIVPLANSTDKKRTAVVLKKAGEMGADIVLSHFHGIDLSGFPRTVALVGKRNTANPTNPPRCIVELSFSWKEPYPYQATLESALDERIRCALSEKGFFALPPGTAALRPNVNYVLNLQLECSESGHYVTLENTELSCTAFLKDVQTGAILWSSHTRHTVRNGLLINTIPYGLAASAMVGVFKPDDSNARMVGLAFTRKFMKSVPDRAALLSTW